jgi:hypothetical protein
MGPKGTIAAARGYLAEIELGCLRGKTEKEFFKWLNQETKRLLRKLPHDAQNWGAARKFLNIFLRGIVYNKHICEKYSLDHIEPWLELPLDSHVAEGLCSEDNGKSLPRWTTVISLDKKTSKKYQDFASRMAKKKGVNRVDLDLIYWRRNTKLLTSRFT